MKSENCPIYCCWNLESYWIHLVWYTKELAWMERRQRMKSAEWCEMRFILHTFATSISPFHTFKRKQQFTRSFSPTTSAKDAITNTSESRSCDKLHGTINNIHAYNVTFTFDMNAIKWINVDLVVVVLYLRLDFFFMFCINFWVVFV